MEKLYEKATELLANASTKDPKLQKFIDVYMEKSAWFDKAKAGDSQIVGFFQAYEHRMKIVLGWLLIRAISLDISIWPKISACVLPKFGVYPKCKCLNLVSRCRCHKGFQNIKYRKSWGTPSFWHIHFAQSFKTRSGKEWALPKIHKGKMVPASACQCFLIISVGNKNQQWGFRAYGKWICRKRNPPQNANNRF